MKTKKGSWKNIGNGWQRRAILNPDKSITYEMRIAPAKYLGPAARAKAKATCSKPKRKAIRHRTPARAKDEARYRARVKVWLALPHNFWCRACQPLNKVMNPMANIQTQPATQVHHKNGRRGRLLLHEPLWIAVCDDCHDIIHKISPEAARESGVLCQKGQWNNQSAVP